jgi:hypothetical protein
VKRICPESKTGLINWIEENFNDIDAFVVTFSMNDNTTMTVYDCTTFMESMGLVGVTNHVLSELEMNGEFIRKNKE